MADPSQDTQATTTTRKITKLPLKVGAATAVVTSLLQTHVLRSPAVSLCPCVA